MLSERIVKIWLSMVVVWFMSCINTSYSRLDEVEITGSELDLILGQFAHHGEYFYENEVTRTKALLLEDENDFVARNDLASAYIKLKQYEMAEAEFNKNEKAHPGKYETAANRGVLYKKMGKYELAADYLAESLIIKEEGHMGLGDYYLRMIKWLDAVEKDSGYGMNFLGVEYMAGFSATVASPLLNKEYLLTLIKNDYSFPDVYMVLGDVYLNEGKYQLAIRCYHRVFGLGHHFESLIYGKLNAIAKELEAGKSSDQLVEGFHFSTHEKQVKGEILAAKKWLDMYQEIEASLLGQGRPVDFKSMKKELENLEFSKPKVKEAMIYKGVEVDENESALKAYFISTAFIGRVVLGFIALCLVSLIIWLIRSNRLISP